MTRSDTAAAKTSTRGKSTKAEEPELPTPMTREEYAHEETVVAELRRINFTGTVWFAAAIIASGIPLAGLLASGWRPIDLPLIASAAWWVGSALSFVGIAGFGWAGCPVLAWAVPIAERQKSICIRGGIGLYLAGTVIAGVAVLASAS